MEKTHRIMETLDIIYIYIMLSVCKQINYKRRMEMLKNVLSKFKFNFAITITSATVGILVTIGAALLSTGVTIILANKSEAICEFEFSKYDDDDYVTIDPKSGSIKYNLCQDEVSTTKSVKYKVGYKPTFSSSYTYSVEYLSGKETTGYTYMVYQFGVRDYKIRLYPETYVEKTKGRLKLKVT